MAVLALDAFFLSGVHPCCFIFVSHSEHCDGDIIFYTFAKK